MSELIKRDLDGAYFRVERNGKWKNICFTDLTNEEIETVVGDRGKEWWKSMAMHLRLRMAITPSYYRRYGKK